MSVVCVCVGVCLCVCEREWEITHIVCKVLFLLLPSLVVVLMVPGIVACVRRSERRGGEGGAILWLVPLSGNRNHREKKPYQPNSGKDAASTTAWRPHHTLLHGSVIGM